MRATNVLHKDIKDTVDSGDRAAEIGSILAMTNYAKEDAIRLDLNFEAYLLDAAAIALKEQLEKEQQIKNP